MYRLWMYTSASPEWPLSSGILAVGPFQAIPLFLSRLQNLPDGLSCVLLIIERLIINLLRSNIKWPCCVMVSTLDSESSDPSLNLSWT